MNLDEQLREIEIQMKYHLNRLEMHEAALKKFQEERKQISKQIMKQLEAENKGVKMAKFNVELHIAGKQCFDEVEADSKEEAIDKCKNGEVQVSLNKTYFSDEDAWEVE